jgi:flagellar biosynthesis protein FlhG
MTRILPIASGKGGVGKSVIAANLGLALAGRGRAVVLVDMDLGASNLHTCLGIRNKHPGLGDFVWKREKSIPDLLVETDYDKLWFIPGDGLLPGTANLEWFVKKRIIKELATLPADYAILDLGAGSSYNVVDFFLSAPDGILVVRPEITSILNAYSFLKTTAFRVLSRSFADKSPGRRAVSEFAGAKTEGNGLSFMEHARDLASRFEGGSAALERLTSLRPRAVMNMGREGSDAALGYRLRDIVSKNLGLSIEFSGYLLEDSAVPASVASRRPLIVEDPAAPFARGVAALAARIDSAPRRSALDFPDSDGGIDALVAEGLSMS